MAAPTFVGTERGYWNLWNKARVKPEKEAPATSLAKKFIANRDPYSQVERAGLAPDFMSFALHIREADGDFRCVLHNGERIVGTNRKTSLVPAGRGPFPTWSAAAIDAERIKGWDKITRWSCERILFESERFNGWGYTYKNANSPYVRSWTQLYIAGKYVADHVYNPSKVDPQPGVAAIIKEIALLDPKTAARMADHESTPPAGVIDGAVVEANAPDKKRALTAGGGAAASGATKVGTEKPVDQPVLDIAHTWVLPFAFIACTVAVIVLINRIAKRTEYIKSVW